MKVPESPFRNFQSASSASIFTIQTFTMVKAHHHEGQRGASAGYNMVLKYFFIFCFLLLAMLIFMYIYTWVKPCSTFTDCYSCASSVCRWQTEKDICVDVPKEYEIYQEDDNYTVSLRQECPASVECGQKSFFMWLYLDPLYCENQLYGIYIPIVLCADAGISILCILFLYFSSDPASKSRKIADRVLPALSSEARSYFFCSYCALLWKHANLQESRDYDEFGRGGFSDSSESPVGYNLQVCICPSHKAHFLARKSAYMALSWAFPLLFVFYCHIFALPLSLPIFILMLFYSFNAADLMLREGGYYRAEYARPFAATSDEIDKFADIETIARLAFPNKSMNEVVEIGKNDDPKLPLGPIQWWEETPAYFIAMAVTRCLTLQVMFMDTSYIFISVWLAYTILLELLHIIAIIRKSRADPSRGGMWEIAPAPAHRFSVLTKESILLIDRSYTALSVVTIPLPCPEILSSENKLFVAEVGGDSNNSAFVSYITNCFSFASSTSLATPVNFIMRTKMDTGHSSNTEESGEMSGDVSMFAFFTEYPFDLRQITPIEFRSIFEESDRCSDALAGHTLFTFPSFEQCRAYLDRHWTFSLKASTQLTVKTGFCKAFFLFVLFLSLLTLLVMWLLLPYMCWEMWEKSGVWIFVLYAIEFGASGVLGLVALLAVAKSVMFNSPSQELIYSVSLSEGVGSDAGIATERKNEEIIVH